MKTEGAKNAWEERSQQVDQNGTDPYKAEAIEPTVCPICFAVFKDYRWQWAARWPIDSHQHICQACHRMRDSCPAGIVSIRGGFAKSHQAEILSLSRRVEQHEKFLYPLRRIMGIEEGRELIAIKTTDIDLPRVIGRSLHQAYGGELEIQYQEESYSVQVNWKREE
jgi:hypothetical protein